MKKILLCSILSFTSMQTHAELISTQIDCPNGGTRAISGDYNPLTGAFDLTATVTECVSVSGMVTNGNVTATGNFRISAGGTLAEFDTNLNYDIYRNHQELQTSTQNVCQKTIVGTYDMQTGKLDGSSMSNCEKTGDFYAPIFELISGFDELESIEKLKAQ